MTQGLGYDPTDRYSFPYQANDPPFDATSLVLEPLTMELAPELGDINMLEEFLNTFDDEDRPGAYRCLDMALRLFYKLSGNGAYNDIAFPDLFAACLHTAMIWERG